MVTIQQIIVTIDKYALNEDSSESLESAEIVKHICQQCVDKNLTVQDLYSNLAIKVSSIPEDVPAEIRMQLNIIISICMNMIDNENH